MPDINFVIPPNAPPEDFIWLPTSDTDLTEGEIVKTPAAPEAVSANDASDFICGVVADKRPATGNVTHIKLYKGRRLKMPIEASHHVPAVGAPVYASSKSAVSADGAGVAATAAAIGTALEVGGVAGDGYVWIHCHWPAWDDKPVDAS